MMISYKGFFVARIGSRGCGFQWLNIPFFFVVDIFSC